MADDIPAALTELAAFQSGIVSRRQILDAGLNGAVVNSRLARGSWQRIYHGVYCTSSGELGRNAQLWAAVLASGPGAILSHQSAAELWRLADTPSSLIHITVPDKRRPIKRAGIRLHLSARAATAAHRSRLPPQTRLEETVLDLWETARDLDAAVGWVTRAMGRWLTTQDLMLRALAQRRKIRWRSQLEQLLSPEFAGVHSVLEYRYVRDVERPHNFPPATSQAHFRRDGRSQYRDRFYEEYKTVVELDGRAAHPGDTRWDDIRRDNAAAADGLRTLRYGSRDVMPTPCAVAAQAGAVLETQGYLDVRPCSPGCPIGRQPRQAGAAGMEARPASRPSASAQRERSRRERSQHVHDSCYGQPTVAIVGRMVALSQRRGAQIAACLSIACIGLAVTACGSSSPAKTSTSSMHSGNVDVYSAGSLDTLMTKTVAPAFHKATGYTMVDTSAGSGTIAADIKNKVDVADVFVSASPSDDTILMGASNGDWVSWSGAFATSPEVLGYYPKSKFAHDLQTMPWYKVITLPGFRLGRTNPSQDPGGVLAAEALEDTATAQNLPALKKLATETSDEYVENTEEADIQTGALDASFMYEADANSQNSPFVKLTGVNLAGDYTIALIKNAPHLAAAEAFIKFLLGPTGQAELKADQFGVVSPATVTGSGVPSSLSSLFKS